MSVTEKLLANLQEMMEPIIEDSDVTYNDIAYCYDDGEMPYAADDFFASINPNYHNGMTKIVLKYDNLDWVYKIPIKGIVIEDDETYEDEYRDYAVGDYCNREVEIYKEAKKIGYGDMLCPTYYAGMVCGFPVYFSPKVDNIFDECDSRDYSNDSWKKAVNSRSFRVQMEIEDVAVFYEHYPKERVEGLLDFLKQHFVNDCHSGNLGFLCGKPVIFDYAGYYGINRGVCDD